MNKAKLNYWIDFFTFIFFVVTSISGLVIFFFMPGGIRQGRFQEFLGIQKGIWIAMHNWSGIIFVIFAVVHFLLHWDWILCMTKNILQTEKCETNNKCLML